MTNQEFRSELERALARSDVPNLKLDLEDFTRWITDTLEDRLEVKEGDYKGNFVRVEDPEDEDQLFAYLALAISLYDDENTLGRLAVGPLEDMLHRPSPGLLERVIKEAQVNPRFRWMLGFLYLEDWVQVRIKECFPEDRPDAPLPPRPWV